MIKGKLVLTHRQAGHLKLSLANLFGLRCWFIDSGMIVGEPPLNTIFRLDLGDYKRGQQKLKGKLEEISRLTKVVIYSSRHSCYKLRTC